MKNGWAERCQNSWQTALLLIPRVATSTSNQFTTHKDKAEQKDGSEAKIGFAIALAVAP